MKSWLMALSSLLAMLVSLFHEFDKLKQTNKHVDQDNGEAEV